MSHGNRNHLRKSAGAGLLALGEVEKLLHETPVSPQLRHLVKLRVSQINGCAYCVAMHLREAREDGETQDRLDQIVVWRHVDLFTPAEKAALDWAEALTTRGTGADLDLLHDALEANFTHEEIGALTLITVMINNWNRLQIAMHNDSF